MTAHDKPSRRPWLRLVPWAAVLIVIILVLPVISFVRNRVTGDQPVVEPGPEYGAVFDAGRLYSVSEAARFRVGPGTTGIAVNSGEPSIEAVLPAPDGGYWLIDHPAATNGGARIRRLDSKGRVVRSFTTETGSTLFTPTPDGGMWYDVASGGGKVETFVRVDAFGREMERHELPDSVFARNICISADGAAFAQAEEWLIDPENQKAIYSSYLVPIVDANGEAVVKPLDKAIKGSFFGADGLYYELKGSAPSDSTEYPAFTVVARDTSATAVRTYKLPAGLKPFAADEEGLVYAEDRTPPQPQTLGVSSMGDAAGEVSLVRVFDAQGEVAAVPAAWPIAVNTWYPTASPRPDGTLVAWRWDAAELVVLTARPTQATAQPAAQKPGPAEARILVTTGMPYCGDPYLAEDAAQRDLWQMVYSGLVSHDASLNAAPELAVAIPAPGRGISGDGTVIEWRIAAGRTWHDGKPVTATDVVATWNHLRAPSTIDRPSPFPGFEYIEDVEAVGDTVRVTLSQPYGPAPESFFPYVLPAHVLEADSGTVNGGVFGRPVGSGPFVLARWERDGRWLLEAATGGGARSIRRLDVVFTSPEKAANDYMASPVPTLWTWLSPSDAATMRRDAVGVVQGVPTGRWWGSIANSGAWPLSDASARDAIMSVHPMDEIRALYLVDESYTALAAPFPGATGSEAARKPQAEVERAAAAKLGRAGWRRTAGRLVDGDGRQFKIRYEQTVRALGKDEILSEQVDSVLAAWRSLGVTAAWNYSRPQYYSSVTSRGYLATAQYDVGAGVFPGFIDPAWGSVFDPADTPSRANPRGLAVTFTRDAVLRRLHEQARAIYDPAKRGEFGKTVRERAEALGLVVFERPEERDNAVLRISGYRPGPYPAGDFWNVAQWTTEQPQ